MFKIICVSIFLIITTGCVSTKDSVIPKGYSGGEASIIDTYKRSSRSTADFYYSTIINDQKVAYALNKSVARSSGQGQNLTLVGQHKKIPVTSPVNVHIVGNAFNVVPISALFNSDKAYYIEGNVSFMPKENLSYLVNGTLSFEYSAVWIEDEFGNIVSEVISKGTSKDKPSDVVLNKDYRSQTPTEIFNSLKGGETFKLVNKKLGQPENLIPFIDEKNKSSFKYKNIGSVQFSGSKTYGYYLTAIQPIIGNTEEEIYRIKRLLLTDHGGQLRKTVLEFYDRDLTNTAALDLFAQKLWGSRNADHRNAVDAMSWICKMLAKSADDRYYDLLVKISKESTESKLRKYAKQSLAKLSPGAKNVFTPE
jgi:hypothetical protein